MRINFDRISQLAGLPVSGNKTNLYENKGHHQEKEEGMHMHGGMSEMQEDLPEMAFDPVDLTEDDGEGEGGDANEMVGPMDEMIEVDEVMLVQELRRAKTIMNENKRRRLNESRRRQIFEKDLKQVIDEEVQNVMREMNLNSQWVYGERRPTRSRKGYTHQGSTLPGLGFRR